MKLLGVQLPTATLMQGARSPLFVVTLNPEILLKAWRDSAYRDVLNRADMRIIDGVGIVIMARLLYGTKLSRLAGADLAQELLTKAEEKQQSVFLLGASRQANRQAQEHILRRYPSISKVGGMGGEFEGEKAINAIIRFKPDLLFVALGAPKQELFIDRLFAYHRSSLGRMIAVGVGGTIDFWARPGLRAPRLLQRIGLEWMWRLARQPWRFFRIVNALIVFPFACTVERLNLR